MARPRKTSAAGSDTSGAAGPCRGVRKRSFHQELVLSRWVLGFFQGGTLAALKMRLGDDRFEGIDIAQGPLDVPLLPGCLASLACERHEVLDGGDHSFLIGRVLQADVADGAPLAWWQGGYRRLADPA